MSKDYIITVLDIGSSTVRALAGRLGNDGKLELLGLGTANCRGIQQGTVIDIKATSDAIAESIAEVQLGAGIKCSNVYIASGGSHITGQSSQGTAAIQGKEVSQDDIESVIGAAKAVSFAQNEHLIHILPQSFSIDGQPNIREPLGMSGVRLEVNCYLISGYRPNISNLRKCAARCSLAVKRIVAEQIADSYGALHQDEQEQGVCLINLGSGTVKLIVIKDGAPLFIKTLHMGGENVTMDIATALRIPTGLAEEYKRRHGCATDERLSAEYIVSIARNDYQPEQEISRQALSGFIQPRYEEIFEMVDKELRSGNLKHKIPAGVVLVGGAARMENLTSLAAEIMHANVRVGVPMNLGAGNWLLDLVKYNPSYTTVCGLLRLALEEQLQLSQSNGFFNNFNPFGRPQWFGSLSNWVGKNF